MKVYRVEHCETGWGPYGDTAQFPGGLGFQGFMREQGPDHDLGYRHPVEGHSYTDPFRDQLRWGFESMRQLHDWFDYFGQNGYDVLAEYGYCVRVYEVDSADVNRYSKQVTFYHDRAEVIRTEEIPGDVLDRSTAYTAVG